MNLTLVLFKNSGGHKEIPLTRPKTVIGRRPECDIRIPKAEISRQHCQIFLEGGTLKVKDLGSSNGTFVNSEKILEAVINAGDQISVGHTTFAVRIDGMPQTFEQQKVKTAVKPAAPAPKKPQAKSEDIEDVVAELLDFDEEEDDNLEPLD